ncbi:sensor histidine kinase [Paenibacillus silvisoli]|uniref:sensor histidine kinase n=1 Tax=Paenibacillus silvisoli TaxID=3110539 RepID=UPI002805D726|nr:histidine kinase [Paenibacillus silvisoli]
MNVLKWLSIKTQLFILAIVTGVVVLSILFIIYYQVTNVIAKNNNVYTEEMTFQIKKAISNNTDLLDRILTGVAYNSIIQDYIMETDPLTKVDLFGKVNNFLLNMQGMNEAIRDIAFVSDAGNSYFMKGRNRDVEAILRQAPDHAINYYTGLTVLDYGGTKRNSFIVISSINSIDPVRKTGLKIGTAAIVFDANYLGLETNARLKDSPISFYLLDRGGAIYGGNNPAKLGEEGLASYFGDDFIVKRSDIPEIGGKIVSVIPKARLFQDLAWIRHLVITMLIFFGIVLLVLFTVIINNILFPLKKLMAFISSVKAANLEGLKQRINLGGYEEMGIVAARFNGMLDEIDRLTQELVRTSTRLYETELGKTQSELAFLRSQINPHFLYNTLESLKGVAYDESAMKTMGMAKALGQIFRYSIKGADYVSVRQELEILKGYVHIQQIRFGDRFEADYSFVDEALSCMIPKMLLQPIVENAVCHGLESKLQQGHLEIGGSMTGDALLLLWVRDDGGGIEEDTLRGIKAQLASAEPRSRIEVNNRSSIGLINIHNQLRMIYGKAYGIEIHSVYGQGTEVICKLPVRRDVHV